MPHLPTWHADRMIVIGDAAHAPSPTSGQGASLSLEDAVALAKCLRDLRGIPAALTRFEALRRPRVERIVKQAAKINNAKAAGPIARFTRDAMLPYILPKVANSEETRRTYMYHIDWDTPVGATAP
ncbi:MAG: FAD-dependent monooxygenase [Kutzneria sp.]|nr:FAD-dependent monooxygenase [Kutzneria sp.]MBV9845397.1 FAD-dependent monooxygenase [Kutzneria sp.]